MDKSERIDELKGKAADAAKKAQETAAKAANKADELYNKLPLDQINAKLRGKVDVKSKNFKIAVGVIAVFLVLLIVFCSAGGASSAKIPRPSIGLNQKILNLNDRDFAEFSACILVKKSCKIRFDEETFKEFIGRCKASLNEKEQKEFQKKYDEIIANIKNERLFYKEEIARQKNQVKHMDIIKDKAPGIINKMLDESYDSCIKVDELSLSYTNEGKDEFWAGVATLKNSKTGKIKRRRVEVTFCSNMTIYVKLTNDRVD